MRQNVERIPWERLEHSTVKSEAVEKSFAIVRFFHDYFHASKLTDNSLMKIMIQRKIFHFE